MDAHSHRGCQLAADDSFGPVVALCARLFDFTLLFEQAILSAIPSIIFLLLSPWRLWSLRVSSQKTKCSSVSIAKLITALALIICQLLLLIYSTRPNVTRTRLSIPATALALSAAVVTVPLSHLEEHRSVRPSTLLNSYLAFSVILDIPQARTLYLIPGQLHPASIFSTALAVKISLLLLEARNKRIHLVEKYETLATETTSGILSRSLFLWMNSLFKRGYSKVISFEDLGPIDSNLRTTELHQNFRNAWIHQDRHIKLALLRSLWKALRWSILSPVLPRLCYSGFLFAQPFLINQATNYLSRPSNALEIDIGYGLIGAAACIYLGIAISNALFKHQLYRHITMVRGSLVSLIYTQSLSMEDQTDDPSAALTLMSTDVDRICQSLVLLHDLWARPFELIVRVSLLALQIGWVCVMPVAVVLVSAIADSRVTLMVGNKVKIWTDAVQRRTSLTADVLSSMKSVKMLWLTKPLHMLLQKERLHELRLQAKYRWSNVLLNTLGNVPPALTAAVTFITFAIKAHVTGSSSLNTSQVFTSLALITLVTTPSSELLVGYPFAASCLGCLDRVQTYLTKPRRHDQRSFAISGVNMSEKTEIRDSNRLMADLSHISISIHDRSDPLLRHLDLKLHLNTFTMILGPSGSGKSTLLKAILSEARYNGTILIGTSRIAYCPQSPWLFTGTVRQNICGLETAVVDDAWYKSVLHACALDSVLSSLRHGDNTRIEGQSSSLSGGQKQRLMLVRALYQRPQLLLLDDILSALDVKTETHIMKTLFANDGLLSKLRAAVVLVTHTRRWEKLASNVVTLDSAGNAAQCSDTQHLDMELLSADSGPLEQKDFPEEPNMSSTNLVSSGLDPEIISDIGSPRNDSDTMDYIYYFKSVRWPLAVMFIFSTAVQTICLYMSQVILVWWTADHGSQEAKWMITYIFLAVGNAFMYGYTVWTMFLRLVPESAANLHRMLLDTVMNAPYSFFTKTAVGTILNRFSQDMTLIESQLPTGVMCTMMYVFWTIGSLALISTGSTWMALTIPAVFIALFFIQRVYLRTTRRLRAIEFELRSPVYSHFMETLKGLSTIRTLKWEDQFTNTMIEKVDESQVPYYLLYCAQRWLQLVLDLIVAALAIVIIALATQLEVSLGAIARTREFSDSTPSEPPPSLPASITKAWPDHGSIEIRNLSAQYSGSKVALNNITMSIKPGEKIGICGRSGSGKSSQLSAILRLLELSSGSIIIDGVDIAYLHHQTIRERLLAIPQDPLLFLQTVRFNLDPDSVYRDDQMITALSKVSLWPVLENRGGLNANITSDSLSQGQKQLFSLARAILRKEEDPTRQVSSGGVLLLDEATNNIDRATDTLIQRIIRDEFSAHTIVVVAHRLETILDSDRITVLDAGSLVEFDSPQALLLRKSAFSALYKTYENRTV